MCRTLAGSSCTVVTARTGTRNTRVIKIHRGPVGGDMTIITHIAGR